jgi:hypothetical protein
MHSCNNIYHVFLCCSLTHFFVLLTSTFLHRLPSRLEAQASHLDKPINIINSTAYSNSPELAVSEGKNLVGDDSVYVMWNDNSKGNGDIHFKRNVDNGTSYGSIENLSNGNGRPYGTHIAISGYNVYVARNDDSPGNGEILFSREY